MFGQGHDVQNKRLGVTPALVVALIPAACFAGLLYALNVYPLPWRFYGQWVQSVDINIALRVDGLSAQFLLLITGIGTLVFVYAAGYLGGSRNRWRIFALLTLFMLAMIGAVASDDMIVFFIFWELTSVLSFLLVGSNHESEESRKSAQQALMVTGLGGLALLAGLLLLGQIAGGYSIHQLILNAPVIINDERIPMALILVFIGAFSKSAQFPFHFWLPNAMAAPTPVSAYLHSATMVKLGVFLLARLDAAFSDMPFWEYTLIGVGTLTAVSAAMQTVSERDLKRILAWSTVATLGTLTMLVGLPGEGAALAVAALFFAHALYKAPLFFVAGNISHGAGTRNIYMLSGLRRFMPWTAAAALLAAFSMAGLPLSLGFIAKNAMSYAKADADVFALVSYATTFVNGTAVAVAVITAVHIFWGRKHALPESVPHEAPMTMLLPPLLLVTLGLLFGSWPTLIDPLLGSAAQSIAPGIDAQAVEAAYEKTLVIETSLLAAITGAVIFFNWSRLHAFLMRLRPLDVIAPERGYWRILRLVPKIAAWHTRFLQHGRLPDYLRMFVAGTAVLMAGLLLASFSEPVWPDFELPSLPIIGASFLIMAGALATVFVRQPLLLLLSSGMVGYGAAFLFLFTGAPDLAFTQFAIETVFVVVVAAVLRRWRDMPRTKDAGIVNKRQINPLSLAVAAGFGGTTTLFALFVAGLPFNRSMADFFLEQSLPAAHGKNVVNVIIVDFRALDTLGEISVLAFALLSAAPLVAMLGRKTG